MLTMAVGYLLCSVSIGVSDGTYSTMIGMFTGDFTGHVQIHRAGYLEKPTLYRLIDDVDALGASLESITEVESWAP